MMTDDTANMRRFRVHARHIDSHHARVVTESSFEAALIVYVEDFPLETGVGGPISVIVRDMDSGHEHCYRVDLETGETAPCG
jgi:hypothetical protein